MHSQRGFFLVLEGGEGVGKSTNMAFIQSWLQEKSIDFEHSREPGGTPLAENIRDLMLSKHDEKVSNLTELLLVFAARAQHLEQKILPVIEQGKWLVCDRFTDATYAYQGGGRQLDKGVIEQLEQLVQNDLRPDCVIILDAPVEIGRERAVARAELDRMESENEQFHQRVRESYLERSDANPDQYAVIDAARPLPDVQNDIRSVMENCYRRWLQDA